MDKRFNKYLSRYGECFPPMRYITREVLRAQGRSLQCLHESAIAYASTLTEEEGRTKALRVLRKRYNTYTRILNRKKKDIRKVRSLYTKYGDKKIKLRGLTKVGTMDYPSSDKVVVHLDSGGGSAFLSPFHFEENIKDFLFEE